MPTFEDEDLVVGKKTAAASTTPVSTEDLDVDWGDTDAMTTSDGLDRVQPADKKTKVRVAVLTDVVKPKMAWLHFVAKADGKKVTIRCHSKRDKKHQIIGEPGLCCQKLNHDDDQRAQLNFAVLVVKYVNADPATGKYAKESTEALRWELGWIKLSRAGFKAVSELVQEDEAPEAFDFTIAYKENGIGYDYKRISKACRFRAFEELSAQILEEAKKFADGVLLSKRLGKVITDVDLKALLAGGGGAKKGTNIDDTSDLD